MIQAKMILDSIDPRGNRLRTLEVIMPRYILAEFNTHRMLSKNSASSRAIPFNKMVQSVKDNTFIPYAWQVDHKGMQGTEYFIKQDDIIGATEEWLEAQNNAVIHAKQLNKQQVTKQLANRLLEPFMYHKVLVSGTGWDNFFNLRCPQYKFNNGFEKETYKSWKEVLKNYDFEKETIEEPIMFPLFHNKGQADIHMMFLAEAIWDATNESTPKELKEGEWHIPYGDNILKSNNWIEFCNKVRPESIETDRYEDIEDLVHKISIARCARLSYQTLGDNPVIDYEKDLELYETLLKSKHASPFEHVAKVMTKDEYQKYYKGQLNYSDRTEEYSEPEEENSGWCRNYRGFIQYRELLD